MRFDELKANQSTVGPKEFCELCVRSEMVYESIAVYVCSIQ